MIPFREVLNLSIPRAVIMGKTWLLWVFRWLESALPTIADLKMLSYTYGNKTPKNQVHVLLWKYLYISFCLLKILKSLFPSHIYT